VPDVEIPIVFTGLRPGEELFEELVAEDEIAESSSIPEILRIRQVHPLDSVLLREKVDELEELSARGDQELLIERLVNLIPTFQPAIGLHAYAEGHSGRINNGRQIPPD
jgi:FlaA1/EpsC-like NDP-sugar epimerase